MEQCEIDLAVPRFVYGCQVLGCFFDEREEDEAEELIGNAGLDYILDALDEEDGQKRDQGEREDETNGAFCQGKFGLGEVRGAIQITVLVGFEDGIEEGVVSGGVVNDETI
jgi:hypothetical protein